MVATTATKSDSAPAAAATIKFMCSYGGKILPRYPDGKLRYLGGQTRVLAVHRSISFPELLLKLGDLCGTTVSLRCQLPTEDLDALVSITSDEDLSNLIEEYDRAASCSSFLKVRAFLSAPKSTKKISPTSSPPGSSSSSSPSPSAISAVSSMASTSRFAMPPVAAAADRCVRQIYTPRSAGKIPHHYAYVHSQYPPPPHDHHHHHHHHHNLPQGNPSQIYLVHNGNYWQ
ncbi:PB1 domain [Dillenia turbinata]|uniref:PB1 domain n=1 Tax=Dillenia turbinata TaxID=194707 RepID=A0AAN8UWZ1_9MAGN